MMLAVETKLAMVDRRAQELLEQQYNHYLNMLALRAQPESNDEREREDTARQLEFAAKTVSGLEAAIVALERERTALERDARRLPVGEPAPAVPPEPATA